MKKTTTFLLLCASLCASAQKSNNNSYPSRKGVYLNLSSTNGISKLVADNWQDLFGIAGEPGITYKRPVHFASSLGVEFGYMMNDHIGIFSGIKYSIVPHSFKVTGPGGSVKAVITPNYVEIPFFTRFVTGKSNMPAFYTDFGIYIGMIASGKIKTTDIDGSTEEESSTDNFSSPTITPFISFGAYIPCSESISLNLGPEVSFTPTNVYDNTDAEGRALRIGLKVSMNIQLTK